jgi:hypothetical protein
MWRRNPALAVLVLAVSVPWSGAMSKGGTADLEVNPGLDRSAPYVHVVIFHLKKDAPPGEADALIADARELLRPIPSVRELRTGPPAVKAKPDRARSDYQVGLLVLFDNQAGLDLYLTHPNHLKFVEKHMKHLSDQLAVYDFLDQRK